jgi:hypothetical protein
MRSLRTILSAIKSEVFRSHSGRIDACSTPCLHLIEQWRELFKCCIGQLLDASDRMVLGNLLLLWLLPLASRYACSSVQRPRKCPR